MQAIGQTLRESRMRQGIDIAEVEKATKIRTKYLRALENEEFSVLPGSTFVRTFLRTYAEFLGLDPQLLVEEYRAQHEPRSESELQPIARPKAGRERDRRRGGGRGPGRGVAIALAAGALVLFLLILGVTGGEEGPAGQDRAAEQAREAREAQSRRDRPAPRRTPRRRSTPTARRVTLRIAPTEATYVCIDDGRGNVKFSGTLARTRTFRGRRLRLNLGKPSAQVRVNGRRVPLGRGPDSVGFDFTPGKRRTLAESRRPCV